MKRALRLFAIVASIGAVSFVALVLWWKSGERARIHDAAVASAHLVPIPDTDYKAITRGNIFSRTYWIAFTSSDIEFENFIASSPGLRDVKPYIFPYAETHPTPTTWDKPPEYTREKMREAEAFWSLDLYHLPIDPSFWDPSSPRSRGRRYEIVIPGEQINGFLLRDDESGEVFLRVSYS